MNPNEQLAQNYVMLYCATTTSTESVKAAQKHAKVIRESTADIAEQYTQTGTVDLKLSTAAIKRLTTLLNDGLEGAIYGIVEKDRAHTRIELCAEADSRAAEKERHGYMSLQQKLSEDVWP
ncbi:hypothetical protein J4219_08955 [Candidatus Woesearchaeota archaeon]|nr:hypothetical protein [Candidatus Woesearchaeota archaeon]